MAAEKGCFTAENDNCRNKEQHQRKEKGMGNNLERCSEKDAQKSISLTHSWKIQLLALLGCMAVIALVLQSYPACDRASKRAMSVLHNHHGTQHAMAGTAIGSGGLNSTPPVLQVFQVYQPVMSPFGPTDQTIDGDGSANTTTLQNPVTAPSCTELLMEYSFGFSYGHPFVGNYIPPSCKFNRVVMNLTVTSKGRQFDRLALMYLGDTEVFRTSTAEPTADGIIWTYLKDMSEYLFLWNQPQKLIFDLGNLIDDTYTGFFNTTLTATFFMGSDNLAPAEMIIPISARNSASDAASLFILPGDTAANTISFPRNANRAVFSVSACGQAAEEFWWSNVLQSNTETFLPADGVLPGYSPWREVQIYIDGKLAGVQWPFPVIFTGGVSPGLWRPIVGIDAFDLREHEIDITPWLPILCDGRQHTFEIKVAGITDDGGNTGTVTDSVGSSWYVTGKIFIWLDSPSSITTGTALVANLPPPHISLSQSLTQNTTSGVNQTLTYNILVKRSLTFSSIIKTERLTSSASWTQSLSYSNYGSFTNEGTTQVNTFSTTGLDTANGAYPYSTAYYYPLFANTTFNVDATSGNFSISATLSHSLNIDTSGTPIHPTGLESFFPLTHTITSSSHLHTLQNGTAYYFASPSTNTGISYGSTSQEFSFVGAANASAEVELYHRDVAAVNGTVTHDREELAGVLLGDFVGPDPLPPQTGVGRSPPVKSPKEAIGRGPGVSKPLLAQGGRAIK